MKRTSEILALFALGLCACRSEASVGASDQALDDDDRGPLYDSFLSEVSGNTIAVQLQPHGGDACDRSPQVDVTYFDVVGFFAHAPSVDLRFDTRPVEGQPPASRTTMPLVPARGVDFPVYTKSVCVDELKASPVVVVAFANTALSKADPSDAPMYGVGFPSRDATR